MSNAPTDAAAADAIDVSLTGGAPAADPAAAGANAADKTLALLDPEGSGAAANRSRIDALKAQVDRDSQDSILSLGAAAERSVAAFADTVLDKVMARDTGDAHGKLSEIRLIIQGLDAAGLKKGSGLFGRLFFSAKREIARFSERFMTAREQVDGVARALEDQIHLNRQSLVTLDKLFDQTEDHFAEITCAVEAARELGEEWKATLPDLEAAVVANPDDHAALQRLRDARAAVELLDRKRMNLEKSRSIAFMHMPAIRQVQNTGVLLIQELDQMVKHAVPAWKTSMVINIEQLRQRIGLKALAAATDFTNAQITGMANALEENTVAIHEQTARGIGDVESIVEAIGTLTRTLDKVDTLAAEAAKAREDGRGRLMEAQRELARHAVGARP